MRSAICLCQHVRTDHIDAISVPIYGTEEENFFFHLDASVYCIYARRLLRRGRFHTAKRLASFSGSEPEHNQ